VSLAEWVVEGVPSALLNSSAPVQLEINFLAEAFYEDCIVELGSGNAEFGNGVKKQSVAIPFFHLSIVPLVI